METFDQLYNENAQRVFKYLLCSTGDLDQAEELLQETFFQVLRSIHRFRGEAQISTWVFAIARRVLAKHFDRSRRQRSLLARLFVEPRAQAVSAEAELMAAPEFSCLGQAISELSDPYRDVLILRGISGLSFREIGQILGRTETWARVAFYRTKQRVRHDLEKGGVTGEG